ncbi:MAG: hypothetical protein Q8867_11215, partial [Bacteroidota bacterium]|nr:hypothetical protein [Bacteroidota bacterium]
EHMYRSCLAFRKAGFVRIDGLPAFDNELESDLFFKDKQLGGRKWMPGIGENLTVRYRFWTQMKYEVIICREYLAIGYYWLKGWI